MVKYTGEPACEGIVIGPAIVLKKRESQLKRKKVENIELEQKRVDCAIGLAKNQLEKLYEKVKKDVGETSAAIFEVHQMMLEDQDFQDKIYKLIKTDKVNAEYAVAVTRDDFSEMFAAMDDEYMKARSADIKDVSDRLVRNIIGEKEKILDFDNAAVIVADDITPSETVQLNKDKILAFVTIHGSTNSHTAILARMMNIPAIVSVPAELEDIKTGMQVVVDGYHGDVIFDPSEEVLIQTRKRIQEEIESFMV